MMSIQNKNSFSLMITFEGLDINSTVTLGEIKRSQWKGIELSVSLYTKSLAMSLTTGLTVLFDHKC